MNILIVVPYFYPALAYGGPAKVVYDLARELAKKYNISIYTTDVWDEKRRILKGERLKSRKNMVVKYYSNIINSIAFKYRIFTSFGMVLSYFREMNKYDIVHINDVFVLPNLLIGLTAILFNKPYVYSPHGVLDPVRTRKKKLFKTMIYELVAKRVLKGAKKIVATSDEEKRVLNQLGFDNVLTIFNGLPTRKFQPTHKFQKYKDKEKLILLYVGKIHPLKGLKELVEALKEVPFSYQLLIAGPDDGDLANIKKIISKYSIKNVSFLGFVNDNEKAELFGISDLFVHPSISEGFSISILEAMNYGLPVLITKACNFPDVAKHKAGIELKGANLRDEIRQTLCKLAENPNMLNGMGKRARVLLVNKYSIESMAIQVEALYQRLGLN